jgi:hypothetical protein
MFSLTKSEGRLLAFLMGGLLLGMAVRHYRSLHKTPVAIEQKAK